MPDNRSISYTAHICEPVSGQPRFFDYRKNNPICLHALSQPQPNRYSMVKFICIPSAPQVPASLRNITTKYNIIVRPGTHTISKPAESFVRASFSSTITLEYLQEFMFSAYTFYAGLQEDHKFDNFKIDWYEALGNLARYCMAMATMTTPPTTVSGGSFASVSERGLKSLESSEASAARIDDSPGLSVGVAAARALELEPEKECWRKIAQDWYAKGLALQPGTGKLHRYLGLLSHDAEGEELRSAYHFLKSMSAAHSAPTREAVLLLWSIEAQARRRLPDASTNDLFVFMHGMLFTHIQVDKFLLMLAWFLQRLELKDVQERDWFMMAIINITALLEFDKEDGILGRTGGGVASNPSTANEMAAQALANAKVNHMVKKMDEIDVDDAIDKARDHEMDTDVRSRGILNVSPILVEASSYQLTEDSDYPLTFKYGLQLTFAMLAHCLRCFTRKLTAFLRTTLNPFITALLTFLVTVMKHKAIKDILECYIPWSELVASFSFIPREPLNQSEGGLRLTAGCKPLPEDHGMRGMEWVGRGVYNRIFWKDVQDGGHPELDALEASERLESSDGIIEDEDESQHQPGHKKRVDIPKQRWIRAAQAALLMVGCVPGLHHDAARGQWKIEGALAQNVDARKDEKQREREAEQRRHTRRIWSEDAMGIDEVDEEESDVLLDSDDKDSDDTEEVWTLRREKNSLSASPVTRSRPRRPQRNAPESCPPLHMVPGFTILVVDTNVLLSSQPYFSALVENLQWTVVPFPVVTELDGVASNSLVLGDAATEVVKYITSHVWSHSR